MKHALDHIYWIGGSPCAGKSTIADLLAARHDCAVYRCDDAYERHTTLVRPDRQPTFARLLAASCDGVWMRPVPQQIEDELALYREEFSFILDDLAAYPADRPVIAEGAALLPDLVAGLGIDAGRAVWIVPTEDFQITHYSRRDWRHDVLTTCTDPAQAWRNWMARDAGFARAVAESARAHSYRVLTVDGTAALAANAATVAAWLSLPTPTSPTPTDQPPT